MPRIGRAWKLLPSMVARQSRPHVNGTAGPSSLTRCHSSSRPPAPSKTETPAPISSGTQPHEDGMERWPGLRTARYQLRGLDYFGTISFASSGAIAAATAHMDALGAVLVGTVTAIGGGTIRDSIILSKQPFWTEEIEYLYMSLLAAGATFAFWPRGQDGNPLDHESLRWADALGVGAFAVIGAQNAIRAGMPTLVTILCGISTATFGGATRDLLTKRPVRILHSHAELYAATAAAGAAAYVMTRAAGAPVWLRISLGVSTSVAARYISWTYGLRLSTWKEVERTGPGRVPTLVSVENEISFTKSSTDETDSNKTA